MRKVLTALALATVVVFGSTGGASADNQAADWLVAGTGTLAPPPQFGQPMLHVNAQSNAGGTNVRVTSGSGTRTAGESSVATSFA